MRILVVIAGAMLASPALGESTLERVLPADSPAWVASAPAALVPEQPVPVIPAPEAPATETAEPDSSKSVSGKPDSGEQEEAAAPAAAAPTGRDVYRKILREKASALGVPFELADAVTEVESSYNRAAVGGVGEVGLMQVLPSTARMLGFSGTLAELANPETNIHYGVTYLARAWRLADRDICTAVMKYRAGHGESRFSHLSVDYCIKVRRGLAARGYAVTGEVPKATFGEPVGGGARVAGKAARKSRLNWRAADARWRAITGKIDSASLQIMQ